MHIQLDEKTKDWLRSKGKPLSVKFYYLKTCCAPAIQDLDTTFKRPKNLQNYTEVQIDDLSIFLEKPLASYEKITLKLVGIGAFKMISAHLDNGTGKK